MSVTKKKKNIKAMNREIECLKKDKHFLIDKLIASHSEAAHLHHAMDEVTAAVDATVCAIVAAYGSEQEDGSYSLKVHKDIVSEGLNQGYQLKAEKDGDFYVYSITASGKEEGNEL